MKQTLIDARALIEKGWTQGYLAANPKGKQVPPEDPEACAFCMIGAMVRASHDSEVSLNELRRAKTQLHGFGSLADFNDTTGRTKAEILEVFDRAIEQANQTNQTNPD